MTETKQKSSLKFKVFCVIQRRSRGISKYFNDEKQKAVIPDLIRNLSVTIEIELALIDPESSSG